MSRTRRTISVGLVLAVVGALMLPMGGANATFPGGAEDLFIVRNQVDLDAESSFASISRYNYDGTFGGGGAECPQGRSLDPNSRIWRGDTAWGDGTFATCNDSNGDGDIYFIPADFSDPTAVTTVIGDHYDPAVSADGGTVAFSSNTAGRRQICLQDFNETTPECVTGSEGDGEDWAPVWSPFEDGGFAFVSTIDGEDPEIYQWRDYEPDTWMNFPVTDNDVPDLAPDYSPTAMDVLMWTTTVNGLNQVVVLNLSDEEPTTVVSDSNNNYEAVFSPDGLKIAFVKQATAPGSESRVYVMPSDGGTATVLPLQDEDDTFFDHPEWRQETGGGCPPNCETPTEERWFGVFKLVKHLKAKGQLFSMTGDDSCLVGQVVVIQKKKSGSWKPIKEVMSGSEGKFTTKLPDKPGSYRATVAENEGGELDFPVICTGATSPAKKHKH